MLPSLNAPVSSQSGGKGSHRNFVHPKVSKLIQMVTCSAGLKDKGVAHGDGADAGNAHQALRLGTLSGKASDLAGEYRRPRFTV